MSTSTPLPVVVGVDGSAAGLAAVRWAAATAVLRSAPLHLVHGVAAPHDYGPGIGVMPIDYDAFRAAGSTALVDAARIATDITGTQVEVDTYLVDAPPVPVLVERSEHAAIVVVGNLGAGPVRRALLGSVSTGVSQQAHSPVAVVPNSDTPRPLDGPVLVGVDGSEYSAPAVALAFAEAARRDADLVAIHVWSDADRSGVLSVEQAEEDARRLISETLAGYAERYPEVQVRRLVAEDHPAKRILESAHNAQLIIVGSHGRTGLRAIALGSVSQAVLHNATIPVILVRLHAEA